MYQELKEHLNKQKLNLQGDWVEKNSSYERYICEALAMNPDKSRYWDAVWNGFHIEFKKGRSIWLDLVRYSEVLLKENANASVDTITLFFVPDDRKYTIAEVIMVETKLLIQKLRLTEEIARTVIQLDHHVPRQLNAQANLTLPDVKRISQWII